MSLQRVALAMTVCTHNYIVSRGAHLDVLQRQVFCSRAPVGSEGRALAHDRGKQRHQGLHLWEGGAVGGTLEGLGSEWGAVRQEPLLQASVPRVLLSVHFRAPAHHGAPPFAFATHPPRCQCQS